jgi:hypothetical protein
MTERLWSLFPSLAPLLVRSLPYWSTRLITQFLDLSQPLALLGQVIRSSQGLYLNTGQHKHRKTRTHIKYPFPRLDSNPQSRFPSDRRLFIPQTSRLPRPASWSLRLTKCCFRYERRLRNSSYNILRSTLWSFQRDESFYIHWSYAVLLQFRCLFYSLDLYTIGRAPWTSGRPTQGIYLNTGQHRHRINAYKNQHPCPKWDSNPRSQRPSKRRKFMP